MSNLRSRLDEDNLATDLRAAAAATEHLQNELPQNEFEDIRLLRQDIIDLMKPHFYPLSQHDAEARATAILDIYVDAEIERLTKALRSTYNVMVNILTDSQLDIRTACGRTIRQWSAEVEAILALEPEAVDAE